MPTGLIKSLQFVLAALVLAAALVLGGGQGTLGDAFVQVAAVLLIGLALWRHVSEAEARLPGSAWLVAAVLALPLLQLLPLPEFMWSLPSARPALADELAAAGVQPSHRWTLVPLATERALLWLLPAVALFLGALQFTHAQRKRLLQLLVALAAVSAVLGLAQLAGGADSALRFYTVTNPTEAVGFFANRNHLASLLALALPLVVVGTAQWMAKRDSVDASTVLGLLAGIGLVALLILGIAIARSRAGLLLGMLGLLASVPFLLGLRRRRGTRRVLVAALALGLTLTVQFALFGILQRLEKDPLEDARFQFLAQGADVAQLHSPLGAGLGGFRRAFEAEEAAPAAVYVNHAHNDYAELWIDAGPLGLLLPAGLLLTLAVVAWRTRRGRGDVGSRRLAGLVLAGLALLALHSLGDYPLRTTALLAAAGLLAGCALVPPTNRESSRLPQAGTAGRLDRAFTP